MRFPYYEYHITPSASFPDGVLLRPEVPLRVIGPAGSELLLALVDTGADTTLLPQWTQEAIGATIDDSQKSAVSGIAGQQLEVVPGEIDFALEQDGQVFRWTTRVESASDDVADAAAILGHAGCVRYFRASFDGYHRELELVPTPDFSGERWQKLRVSERQTRPLLEDRFGIALPSVRRDA